MNSRTNSNVGVVENLNFSETGKVNNSDPTCVLKSIKHYNINRLVIGSININGIYSKFDSLVSMIKGVIDILINTTQQFLIEGCLIYVREDLGVKWLHNSNDSEGNNLEGIFFEVNLKKKKWLMFGGYNNIKENIDSFFTQIGSFLDLHMVRLDNFLLLGDFNSEITETASKNFCEIYNLKSLIREPTCFKNPLNPSTIDLILTNRWKNFQNSQTIESGLSDHHIMTISVMK